MTQGCVSRGLNDSERQNHPSHWSQPWHRSLAKKLDAAGARLILIARTAGPLKELADNSNGRHAYYQIDLSNPKSLPKATEALTKNHPQIDGLINVAGIGIYKNIQDYTPEDVGNTFSLNVGAPIFLTRLLLPMLEKRPESFVMNIGSGAGVIPMRGHSIYCASKFALRGFTLSLAEEYQGKNPRFILITLGSTLTGFGMLSLEEKRKKAKEGKAYFPVDWVAEKLVSILETDKKESEYVLYPSEHGFGEWKKP